MSFNYTKNTKNMLFYLLIIPFIIWIISIVLLFSHRPLYKSAEYWIKDIITIKDYNFQNRNKDRKNIFFISGSNSLFGISTPILEEKLNYNIHNLGMHAGLPLYFYLNLAKKYAQKGDIIIAPLEYDYQTRSNNLGKWIYAQFTTWGIEHQSFLSQEMRTQLFNKNLYAYWERLPFLYRALPITEKNKLIQHVIKNNSNTFSPKAYHGLSLTKHGESFIDAPQQTFTQSSYLNSEMPTQFFIDEINQFNTYAKEHDIKFYVTYPVSVKSELFNTDTKKTQEQLNNYEKVYDDAGINFFGTSAFYNVNIKYFYGSSYHLNATGAVLRSLLLAEDINTYVLNKESSYDIQSEKARKDFFQQKEKEALEIMEKLREEDKKSKEQKSSMKKEKTE